VQQAAPSLGLTCGSSITVSPSPDWKSGSSVTVSAHTSYPISVLGIDISSVTLSSSTTERIE
jgi:hypothetical protein